MPGGCGKDADAAEGTAHLVVEVTGDAQAIQFLGLYGQAFLYFQQLGLVAQAECKTKAFQQNKSAE